MRKEITGWRDAELSARHRDYGINCPAADIDLLLVEFNYGLPVALIEYKRYTVEIPSLEHPTYRAIRSLADNYSPGPLPFVIAHYWPKYWTYKLTAVNAAAQELWPETVILTEYEYVRSLYLLRRRALADEIGPKLVREKHPEAA